MTHLLSSPTWTNFQYPLKKRLSGRPVCSSSHTELTGQVLETLLSFFVPVWFCGLFFFNITWICYLEKRTVNHLENLYKLNLHLYRIRIKWIKKTGYSVWEGQGSLFPGWNLKIWPSYSIHIIEFEWKLPCCSPVFKVKLIPTSWTHQQFLYLSVWMILFSIKTSLLVSNLPLYCI